MFVLEISRIGLFKALFPKDTRWIRWGSPLTADEPVEPERPSIVAVASTLQQMARQDFDLLVLPATHIDHQYDQSPLKLKIKSAIGRASSDPLIVSLLNRLVIRSSRHVILDINDSTALCGATMRMFPKHDLYFKRELDLSTDAGDTRYSRIRPLSLFVPSERHDIEESAKTVDVFFAGNICNDVRRRAVEELRSLSAEGFTVHVPAERLSYREYLQCMSRSWIVLSPEGYGWDCYRHYEAGFAGSVALINYPTYQRSLFLRNGEHCVYYDASKESPAQKIRLLLQDKTGLLRIAEEARRHVLSYHTRSAVARSILEALSP